VAGRVMGSFNADQGLRRIAIAVGERRRCRGSSDMKRREEDCLPSNTGARLLMETAWVTTRAK